MRDSNSIITTSCHKLDVDHISRGKKKGLLRRFFRQTRLVIALLVGLSAGTASWAKPVVQAIVASPNPALEGQLYTVNATVSTDVTHAEAIVEFSQSKLQQNISLTKNGSSWVGSALMPVDLALRVAKICH